MRCSRLKNFTYRTKKPVLCVRSWMYTLSVILLVVSIIAIALAGCVIPMKYTWAIKLCVGVALFSLVYNVVVLVIMPSQTDCKVKSSNGVLKLQYKDLIRDEVVHFEFKELQTCKIKRGSIQVRGKLANGTECRLKIRGHFEEWQQLQSCLSDFIKNQNKEE